MKTAFLVLFQAVLAVGAWAAGAQAQAQGMTTVAYTDTGTTLRPYRLAAAQHIYSTYATRIFKGKLPPLMHAVVVTETEVADDGRIVGVRLVRVPSHAPDVAQRVVAMIHAAAPLPSRSGGATFTEVWLVDRSGQFQLDALTEGQH